MKDSIYHQKDGSWKWFWKSQKTMAWRMMLSETKQRSHLGSGGRKVKSSWFSCRLQLFKTAALKIWQQTLENTKKNFGWKTKAFLDRISPLRESLEKHEALDPYFKFLSIFPSLSLSLSEAETTFNQLSNAKSLQNICCNRSSVESLLNCRSFFFWSLGPKCDRQLVSFHWNIGKLGGRRAAVGWDWGFNQFLSFS